MPVPRRKPEMSNYDFLCALLYIIENGCKWRALPNEYGKVHPDAAGARKSSGEHRTFKRGLTAKIHLAFTSAKYAMIFRLSAENKHDAPEGRKFIENFYPENDHYVLMDRAYEDNETRELAMKQGFVPVVPPKGNRKNPWDYDKELYKPRNEIERYFLRIKRFRRVFTRYDKLDILYLLRR